MKKRILVRCLSLLMTGMLLVQSPLQVFAKETDATAEKGDIFADMDLQEDETEKQGEIQNLKVQMIKSTALQLTWSEVTDAQSYEVYYSTSPDSDFIRLGMAKTAVYNFKKAKCGLTYYFKVRSCRKIDKMVYYSDFSPAVSGRTVLSGIPEIHIAKTTYNSVTIKWSKVKDAKKYEIYYSDSPDGEYYLLKSQGGNSFTHKKLNTGTVYYYKVRALRDFYYSDYSDIVSTRPVLSELIGLKVAAGANQLNVSWKKVKGAENYVILRSDQADGIYTEIARLNKTSYKDTGLTAGKVFYYKVYAVAGSYQTDAAGPAGQTVKAAPVSQPSPSSGTSNKSVYYGVDVSSYQGRIDWNAVAGDGIDFAMLRILTGKDINNLSLDSRFEYNYTNARAAGIKVGVYRYSYATTRSAARQEAYAIIEALGGRKLNYPIVLDMEEPSVLSATTREKRTQIIQVYKEVIEGAGYKFALYANKNWLDNYIEPEAVRGVDIWFARWRSLNSGHGYSGAGNLTMWQYSDSGTVRGISGKVDLDVSYKSY